MKGWLAVGLLAAAVMAVAAGWGRAVEAQAPGVYYVAADGKADGDGTKERPFASADAAFAKVGGGSTLIFRPGIYRGPICVPLRCKGTKERPTVLKSEAKWKAVVIGAEFHAITNSDRCDWVVVDGFEVLGARYDGIKMNGDFNTVHNCYVHNNSHMGVAMHNRTGGVIENNLIEFNGSHVQFHHGVYADGDGLTVRGNIVRHNAGFGLHLYPSIKNATVVNNLVYGQARKPGIIVACPKGGGRNVVANNTVALNGGGLQLWDGDGETVVNNIFADNGATFLFNASTKNVTVDHNLLQPSQAKFAARNLNGDPRFVEPARGAFWLRPDSPAIGKGTAQDAPAVDFWGRPRAAGGSVDIGCFPFVPALAEPGARSRWYQNWPYRFAPTAQADVPDLWALP